LVCNIYYTDRISQERRVILGSVPRDQIFSKVDLFIGVGNVAIPKSDIEKIVIYKKEREIVLSKRSMEANYPLEIEG